MKYLVVEIQTDSEGEVANIVTAYEKRNEAESKYYTVLAAAAVSDLTIHGCMLMTNEGYPLLHYAYAKYGNMKE